ncbi:MAG: helix-turn-helix transcriptional regulator [Lachnospiraceae bacterium]|nr:helix-turn-helix transcriptional regulator [Lachnospiraceae bacterium]
MKNYTERFDIYSETNCMFRWDKNSFGLRLATLREEYGSSARKMSLDLGQNKNYINSIESGKNFPTMEGFLNICDYLHMEPHHFFHHGQGQNHYFSYFEDILNGLNDTQINLLYQLAVNLASTSDSKKLL